MVVLDLPRKGCEITLLDAMVSMSPERVIYVSCNPATLARDLKYLDGRDYKTVEVQPVDMFPHTCLLHNINGQRGMRTFFWTCSYR